jgi:hypothetical protein
MQLLSIFHGQKHLLGQSRIMSPNFRNHFYVETKPRNFVVRAWEWYRRADYLRKTYFFVAAGTAGIVSINSSKLSGAFLLMPGYSL